MPRGRNGVMGEHLAQVDNRDPFAAPIWRSPVYRTPEPVIFVVQLVRLVLRLLWFALTHPLLDAIATLVVVTWLGLGWPGVAGLALAAVAGLAGLRVIQPEWFARFVAVPAGRPGDRTGPGRLCRPVGEPGARVRGAAVPGPRCFAGRAGAGASPRGHPRRPDPGAADSSGGGPCRAAGGPVRRRVAVAAAAGRHARADRGATGSGKGSVIWSLIRALLPAISSGWVQVWALDPKRMELSFGRALFHRYACQAAAMVELLEAAVAEMHDRAQQFGGRTRTFTPSTGFPFLVILVDELAFLTAYQPERDLRKRAEAAIATLTSQGRSVGVCVVGALQDPRKDVISLRNLFSTRIALRLDESDQVDMVLGDGARDRGALADQISPLPYIGAGVGYVRLEASPDPVRIRAAYVTDDDICAMVATVGYLPGGGL